MTMAHLATAQGRELLASLPPYVESEVLRVTSRLRAEGVPPEIASAALTQSRLRARARPRLGALADHLLLTQDGLEQATRPAVARRHAQRYVDAGVERVWDLGCGLGLDALGFAEAGLAVTAVERDPEVAAAAAANLSPYPRVDVVRACLEDVEPAPREAAWFDPARRTPGVADARGSTRRLWRLSDLSPSWDEVRATADRLAATGAKLSPGFRATDLPAGAEAEWVSVDGDVVECVVWWGDAVRRPGISAVVGQDDQWHVVSPLPEVPDPLAEGAGLLPYLAEPDRAVLAAGLSPVLAATVAGHELDDGVGYVTAPTPVDLPWARWYAVEEVLPLHAKAVRAWLRDHGYGRVTIKKRGVPTDPDRFRTELRLRAGQGGGRKEGTEEATLVLTRVAGSPQTLVVRPVTP